MRTFASFESFSPVSWARGPAGRATAPIGLAIASLMVVLPWKLSAAGAGERQHPARHPRLHLLDLPRVEEILRLHAVHRIDRAVEILLVAERYGGVDSHAALELSVRRGPGFFARGHALGRHEGLPAPARDRVEDVGLR